MDAAANRRVAAAVVITKRRTRRRLPWKSAATQLANIQKKTGKSLDELAKLIRASGLARHGEICDMLKRDLGLGHGDANTLVHVALKSDGQSAAEAAGHSEAEVLAAIYTGPKAALRPIHDAFMSAIRAFGPFEVAPKKGYVSSSASWR